MLRGRSSQLVARFPVVAAQRTLLFGGLLGGLGDLENYRKDYPFKVEDSTANENLAFYRGTGLAQPGDRSIATMHSWFGDYLQLEEDHNYIQWLFPIQEPGVNWESQPLMKHERAAMRADIVVMDNFRKSYKMMLDFYGMRLADEALGAVVVRGEACDARYDNLAYRPHNWLRITRMLKSLGELGLEEFKIEWLRFLRTEIFVEKRLSCCARSFGDYWCQTIYDDSIRQEMAASVAFFMPKSSRLLWW